ncbi:MAG: hypothetical protein ACXV2C_08270 [Candidatus Bathyarchaeia archaeon]
MDANNAIEMDFLEGADAVQTELQPPALLPKDYEKHHILIVNGKVKRISHSSAYILDMLTKND